MKQNTLIRNSFVDIVSGIFVVEIIIYHLLLRANLAEGSFYSDYVIRYLSVFMPWFYFKAGMMFNHNYGIEGVKKRSRKLLWPFFTWSLIASIIMLPLALYKGDFVWWCKKIGNALLYGQGPHNVPLWFLLSLFLVYFLVYYRIVKSSWIYIIALGVLAWLFNLIPIKLPLGISNLPLGALFFILGNKLNSLDIKLSYPQIALTLASYIALVTLSYSQFNFRWNKLLDGSSLNWGGYFIYLIETFLLLFVMHQISKRSSIHCKPLEFLGKKSMVLYVSHMTVIGALTYYNSSIANCWNNYELLLVTGLSVVLLSIILFLFDSKIQWLYQR